MGRIISYDEKTGCNDGDYLLLDNGEGGTKRIRADRVGIKLDHTLSQSGQAADAKEVGDGIADLKSALDTGFTEVYADKSAWYNGHITSSGIYDSNTSYMSISNAPLYASEDITLHVIPNGLRWGMRFFSFDESSETYTQITNIYNATDERTVNITKGQYYSFNVSRGGGAMSADLNVCVFQQANTIYKLAESIEKLDAFDKGKLPSACFIQGGLSNGKITNTKYRVSTPDIISFDHDLVISIATGWRFAINYFNDSGVFSRDSGWITTKVAISANQKFKMMIRRETEDTSEIADVDTFVSNVTVVGGILTKFDMPQTYNHYVDGEKLNVQKTRYNINVTTIIPSSLATVGAVAYQSVGYNNGVLFQFYKDDYVELIDYDTGDSIAILSSPTAHGNSVNFLNDYYADDDEFPIALVSDSTSSPLAYLVRITRSAVTLLDTISFPVEHAGYYANAVIDAINNIVFTVGYAQNTFSSPSDNYVIVAKWNFAQLNENQDQTKTPVFIESFALPFINTLQGMTFWNGKIYAVSSKVSSTEADTKVYIINPFEKRISNVMTQFRTEIVTHETEGLCFIDDREVIKAIIFTGGYSYREIEFS